MTIRRFRYRFVDASGQAGSDVVLAESRVEALRQLAREARTVVSLVEAPQDAAPGRGGPRVNAAEAILVLRQLAVMLRAGVGLLEAIDIIADALRLRPVASSLDRVIAGLRRGDRLAKALREAAPFYPPYVYALIGAGEASGRLALVLEEAARQMAFERSVRRDIQNALVYPGFLVVSGLASVTFLFYVVVPRFAEMLHNARAPLEGLSGLVIGAGVAFHDNALFILIGLGLAIAAAAGLARAPAGKQLIASLALRTPGLNALLATRMRASWSKIMALALLAGVDVLQASALATEALPEGKFKRDLGAAGPMLRSGRAVDEVFLTTKTLSIVDASLIRAGQRSGALGDMFRAVAERNEEEMRQALKRLTIIVEPLAIAVVASLIGAIVLGLVSALASIYDAVG